MRKRISSIITVFLSLAMVLSLLPANAVAASTVSYVRREWKGGDHGYLTDKSWNITAYSTLNSNSKNNVELKGGWYVLDKSVTYSKCLRIYGDVSLVLCDGKTLTANEGIYIKNGCTLTVYGQKNGTGAINAKSKKGPGIGGLKDTVGGSLVIHGGTITAKGDTNAAGIGGGNHKSGMRNVTIYGGKINATGGSSGAGIGMGQQNNSFGTVSIYGGTVNANGGNYAAGIGGGEDRGGLNVKIYGGTINANGGKSGAGIGGGEGGSGSTLTVYGGTVNAKGGEKGAGIGGGQYSKGGGIGGTVNIKGGDVKANGGKYGAGIGGGQSGTGGNVTISDGTVNAKGGKDGAGIGGGESKKGGNVTISGGTVTASGGETGAGIGGGENGNGGSLTITGGSVTTTGGTYKGKIMSVSGGGAGIGGGKNASGGSVNISGGKVVIWGGAGSAAIGGAMRNGNGGDVTISGGEVEATAGAITDPTGKTTYNAAAIGAGISKGKGGNVRIIGGKVTVTTHNYAQLIGVGGEVNQAGIGYTYEENSGNLELGDSMVVHKRYSNPVSKDDRYNELHKSGTRIIEEGRQGENRTEESGKKITVDKNIPHMSITVDKAKADKGENVTVTAKTEGSYSPKVLVLKTSDRTTVQEVNLTGTSNGFTGSFSMPDYDVTVTGEALTSGDEKAENAINSRLDATWKGSEIRFVYGPVSEAGSFEIYAGYTGEQVQKIGTAKSNIFKIKNLDGKKLEKNKIVMLYVIAKNGDSTVAQSLDLYVAGPGNKYTNTKKIKISRNSYSLKKGKSKKLSPRLVLKNSNKKRLPDKYAPKFRYQSTNTKIATVSRKGKVTAKKKGNCKVYIFAANGMTKTVNIKVK